MTDFKLIKQLGLNIRTRSDESKDFVNAEDLERVLEESQAVYGNTLQYPEGVRYLDRQLECHTTKARVILIEKLPVKECEHLPSIRHGLVGVITVHHAWCSKCNKTLVPTGWKVSE